MAKDRLFLIKPGFSDGTGGPFYCPGCAHVEGVLSFYPWLRTQLDVTYVDFARPRPAIVALVGAENQGAPVLVLEGEPRAVAEVEIKTAATGKKFVSGEKEIGRYLAASQGSGKPH